MVHSTSQQNIFSLCWNITIIRQFICKLESESNLGFGFFGFLIGKCEEELKEKLRKWNECLKDKGLKINEEKTKVMYESFGAGTTQVTGNVKHLCSVCLKGVGVNSIRCTQCVQWLHVRCSRVKGSLLWILVAKDIQVFWLPSSWNPADQFTHLHAPYTRKIGHCTRRALGEWMAPHQCLEEALYCGEFNGTASD